MSASNATVAGLLRRYAAALALQGADRFRLKAYRRAAETIEGLHDDIADRIRRGSDLTDLPGIGKGISQVIQEIAQSGTLARLDRTLAAMPPQLAELAGRPALDPKVVARVYKKLKIGSLAELQKSLDAGTIRDVLGSRVEFHIRRGLAERPRRLLWEVEDLAANIERFLRAMPGVTRAAQTGSLRRQQDTVGDLNFLVAGKSAAAIFDRFSSFGAVESSESRGRRDRLFRLSSGIHVNLRWSAERQWGLSMVLSTGSAAHLADLPKFARADLNARSLAARRVRLTKEEDVYVGLGLPFIEPELREGRGEVLSAQQGNLPKLIEQSDLRGDLHMHTTESDGVNTVAEMAAAARERGYEYIAITDHSKSLRITNGLSEERLLQHIRQIDRLNAGLSGFRILKSAEVDILADGSLDYSDEVLKELDLTVCSIHSRFALDKRQQTERILRAMDNPYFTILGHATGRLLLRREGYEFDMERVMRHAKARGCLFEINSSPDRLDLSDEHAKMAKELGIKIAINTDAHAIGELDFIAAGIRHARRGWLEAGDVVNTLPLQELLSCLRR